MATKRKRHPKGLLGFLWTIAIALVLFTSLSLFSFLFKAPNTNYAGRLGYYLASALYYLFGKMSLFVPLLSATAIILGLVRTKNWRRYNAFLIITFTIFFGASLLSYYSGLSGPQENFGGWIGTISTKLLTQILGLGTVALWALGFYWGFVLWFRKAKPKDITPSLFILLIGLFLILFLAHFHAPEKVSGLCGRFIVNSLKGLIGSAGTIIFLLASLVIIILLLGSKISALSGLIFFLNRTTHWIKNSFIRGKALLSPKKKPLLQIEVPAAKEKQPVITETQGEKEPLETIQTTSEKIPPSITPRQLIKFDTAEFQRDFLNALDQPTDQNKLFKDPAEAEAEGRLLLNKLKEFGIEGKLTAILSGPMITRFELEPAPGVRCSGIESLADDIALALSAERVRILAPIPGKSAVGVEIPNKTRRTVYLKEVITSDEFSHLNSPLGFALGTTITGEPYCADLRQMPHILIAGTTGSGKSVCINSIIISIIYRSTPEEVRFLTIDPKQLELPVYNSIPHLLSQTTINPERVVHELSRIVNIMEARYSEFAELGVRDIASFNARCEEMGKRKKPYIVVVVDELADLMQRAPAEIEARIIRLAQMSRAVGIHLILATQRPSVDVITGLIKANFPCRIAFQVATKVDSRTILDANGAESLLGRGDMLFLPPGKGEPIRLHGCFVSERAAKRVVDLWAIRYLTELLTGMVDAPQTKAEEIVAQELVELLYDPKRSARGRKLEQIYEILPAEVVDKLLSRRYYEPLSEEGEWEEKRELESESGEEEYDEFFFEAARLVVRHREASVSMLQRRLDVGWARAGRIIDQLERAGVVGPYAGSKPRKVLIENETDLEKKLKELSEKNG